MQGQNVMNKKTMGKAIKKNTLSEKGFEKLMIENVKQTEKKVKTEKLNMMIQSIEQYKQALDHDLTVENLNKFKDSVRSYLEYYTKNEMSLEQHFMKERHGERKLQIIKTVDDKIGRMTENMLETSQGHLKLLKESGEIYGLLVNEFF